MNITIGQIAARSWLVLLALLALAPVNRARAQEIRSLRPTSVELEPNGKPALVLLRGNGLEKLDGVRVLRGGRSSRHVTGELQSVRRSGERVLRLTGSRSAAEGSYRVEVVASRSRTRIPLRLSVAVRAPRPSPGEAAADGRASGASAESVLETLVEDHGQDSAEAAGTLRDAGYPLDEIAAALLAYGAIAVEDGFEALLEAGYSPAAAAQALLQAGASGPPVAAALRTAGVGAHEAAAVIRLSGLTADAAGEALEQAGYDLIDLSNAVMEEYQLGDAELAALLDGIGVSVMGVGFVLQAHGTTAPHAAAALEQAGFTLEQIGEVLADPYGLSAHAAAIALKAAGFGARKTARVVRLVYLAGGHVTAKVLRAAGYGWKSIAGGLRTEYSASAGVIAGWLRDAGAGARQVTQWLLSTGRSAAEAAKALVSGGFDAAAVATALVEEGIDISAVTGALVEAFNWTVPQASAFIAQLGLG